MRNLLACLFPALIVSLASPQEAFDVAAYSPPKDWKKEIREDALVFSKTTDDGKFGLVTFFRSIEGSGDAKKDFVGTWENKVKVALKIDESVDPKAGEKKNGWQQYAGGTQFKFEGLPAIVLLSTYSNQNRLFCFLVVTNSQELYQEWDAPLEGIKLAKPEVVRNGGAPKPAAGGAFAFVQTNFDDGWVATIEAERVAIAKPDLRVYAYFALAYDDDSRRRGGDFYCWDSLVRREFRVETTDPVRRPGDILPPPYIEGTGTDPATGKKCFLALYVSSNSGRMMPTLAVAKDEATFRKAFPKAGEGVYPELPGMRGYNRFAVGPNDVSGTWNASDSAAMDYYSTVSGNYMGMNAVATSDTFLFNKDGSYASEHKGASGMVGNMGFFQQKFKGSYSVSNWEMKMDHRFNDATEIYAIYFEAVRGGRILHMQNKKYTGSWFHLARKG